jgi:tetratricopeptide (TPR) repeat protein
MNASNFQGIYSFDNGNELARARGGRTISVTQSSPVKHNIVLLILFAFLAAAPLRSQTFEINGQPAQPQQQKPAKRGGKNVPAQNSSAENGFSFGTNIEVARENRAAQEAMKRGNASLALAHAEKAAQLAPGNKTIWLNYGYTARLAGKNDESLQAYQHVLQNERGSLDAQSGMAQTYMRMGNTNEARRLLTQVVNADPKRLNDVLILGEMEMREGNLQQAISMLQRAEAQAPSAHAELLMAVAYMKLKQPDKAKHYLDAAKARAPRNPEVYRAIANFFRETHDYKAAITALQQIQKPTPDTLADLGYTYELDGDKKESAAAYARAANAAPATLTFQLSAAQEAIVAGDLNAGKQFLTRAQGLDANSYRLHAIRALLARTENRPQDAIKEYEIAIANLPHDGVPEGELYPVQLHLNLADLLREQGDEAGAKQQIKLAEDIVNRLDIQGTARAEFLRVRAAVKSGDNDYTGAESDLKQAMQLDPDSLNIQLQYGNLLWKMKRLPESQKVYTAVLQKDPKNRYALESLGYLARDGGDSKAAEQWFLKFAADYPDDYVPHLALGDLYTATRDFAKADHEYAIGYKLAPQNATIVGNAANAAIEARRFDLAGAWLARATGAMNDDGKVMLERERWLFHIGKYRESAQLGYKVLQKLPRDRNAAVYLGYALYNLGRYDDVLALVNRLDSTLPKEPNLPLLAGHVHKQGGLLDEAADDYSRALERDPKMVEAYINRGYVENDLQDAENATSDFHTALKLNPNNGTAYLGLSFSNLEMHHGKAALEAVDQAQKIMGESGAVHLARATAYRQMRQLQKAETEYRVALKYAPDDLRLNMALADTLYHERKYRDSIQVLSTALQLSPGDPLIYAQLAAASAELRDRAQTLNYIAAAEHEGADQAGVLLATGSALLTLGDRDAAMDRFARAMQAPDADKVDIRLAIAKLFVNEGKYDDARQQIALAFAEARIGEAAPPTADDLVEAANTFLAMRDFSLAQRYYARAKDLGAGDEVIAVGMANTNLARGNTDEAAAELARLGTSADNQENFDYQMAMANVYRQRHDNVQALTAFAQANELSADDDVAERALEEVAGDEGYRINQRFSALSDLDIGPIFDDSTIYTLDAKLFGVAGTGAPMPPPRSQLQTLWTNGFRYHVDGLPLISGFFQLRNAFGTYSVPSELLIIDRNTFDYNFNGALNPVLRFGRNSIQFNTGLQYTIRRDHGSNLAALELNQNLFRQFAYFSSNSFFNWIAVHGHAFHEAGPFTNQNLSSRDVGANLEFTVGRPWGRTAMVTGYSVRDLQFNPLIREFFTTSTYVGLQRQLGQNLKVTLMGEYIRSWRVQDLLFATAQAMRPAASFEYRAGRRWTIDGQVAFDRGEGFNAYDNIQSGFFISYDKPLRRNVVGVSGDVPVEYPLRFSVGLQQDTFPNFTGHGQAMFRPVVRLTIF